MELPGCGKEVGLARSHFPGEMILFCSGLPTGTQIRNPNLCKVAALRLGGNGDGLQFAGARVDLQTMKAVITNSTGLIAWTREKLDWSKDETLARLQDKFRAPKFADLGAYIEWVHELGQNGFAKHA